MSTHAERLEAAKAGKTGVSLTVAPANGGDEETIKADVALVAVGRHPATAVAIMSRIIRATESAEDYRQSIAQFAGTEAEASAVDVVAATAQAMASADRWIAEWIA